ncbi:MAG: fimbria/pilus outer membrane usher protein [Steroidobacteraceae bacterium]
MRSRSRVDRAWLAAAALLCGPAAIAGADDSAFSRSIADAPPSGSAVPAAKSYYLEVLVNGQPTRLIVTCEERGGAWWMPLAHLKALGLRVDDLRPDAAGWISLAAVSGLSTDYDPASQRLHLAVLASRRNLNVLRHVPKSREGDSAAGALMNYDALTEWQSGTTVFRAYTEQRAFGDWGVISNSGTVTSAHGASEYLRLETLWTRSNPATLRSIAVGDLISRSLAWSRSARLGGLQVARNFALRPDLVTYPVAGFSGEVALPSTVDVYVNQVRQMTGSLPPGPFRVETPPSLNGAGQATLVVRDLLGRETVQTLDLYVVPQLLAEGLSDYSFEAGLLRDEFGLRSIEYRSGLVGSGSLRYGLNERLTLESHAEGASGLAQLGAGLLWQVGMIGRISASLSASDADGSGNEADGAGEKFGIGYQYVASRFNLTAELQRASSDYRDLPSLLGEPPPRRQLRIFSGLQLGPLSHMSASYVETDGALPVDDADESSAARLASIGYRRNLGRRSTLYLTAFRDFEQDDGDGVYLGWSTALGDSAQLHSEYASADERTGVTLTSRSPYAGGWDWMLRGSRAEDSLFQAASRYTDDYGAIGVDYAHDAGKERWQVGGRGAFVLADRQLIAGRYVQDEFALISTNGLAGVPVLHENRPVGHTNADGLLLLPNVNAYQPNRVAIDPLAIPFGYRLDHPDRTATPRMSAGTVVRFPIERPRAAVFVLVDAAGEPLPAGSQGEVVDQDAAFVVGYDGVVYLSGLRDVNRLRVVTRAGACEAEFEHEAGAEVQADLGRVNCR